MAGFRSLTPPSLPDIKLSVHPGDRSVKQKEHSSSYEIKKTVGLPFNNYFPSVLISEIIGPYFWNIGFHEIQHNFCLFEKKDFSFKWSDLPITIVRFETVERYTSRKTRKQSSIFRFFLIITGTLEFWDQWNKKNNLPLPVKWTSASFYRFHFGI